MSVRDSVTAFIGLSRASPIDGDHAGLKIAPGSLEMKGACEDFGPATLWSDRLAERSWT
jgi:hypothetical protein